MEQRKGKLLRAEKLIVNGEHYTKSAEWEGTTSLYYYFTVEFDNGDKGSARSKSPQGAFKMGDEYSYNVKIFTNNGYENKSFSSLKNLSRPFKGGGGYKKDNPETTKQIMNQVALIATNMVMRKIDMEYINVYKALRNWLYTQVFDNGEESKFMSGILKIATKYYQEADIKAVKLESVTLYATSLIKLTKDISWEQKEESQSQKSTNSSSQPASVQQEATMTMKLPADPTTQTPPVLPEPKSDLPF